MPPPPHTMDLIAQLLDLQNNASFPGIQQRGKKLYATFGIEYTVMYPKELEHDFQNLLTTAVRSAMQACNLPRYNGPDRDGERALEVSTKPMQYLSDIKAWYDCMSKVTATFNLKPHADDMISGGGHIHAGIPEREAVMAFRDILRRPYLLWVFNDHNDKGCHHFNEMYWKIDKDLIEIVKRLEGLSLKKLFSYSVSGDFKRALIYHANDVQLKTVGDNFLFDDKQYVLRWAEEHETLEFRFFDAPLDWAEQESHILFVDAYLHWLKKWDGKYEPLTAKEVYAYNKEKAITEFNAFIVELGLDPKMYESQIERNVAGWMQGNKGLHKRPRQGRGPGGP